MFKNFSEVEKHLITNDIKKHIVLCGSHDSIGLHAVVRAKRKGFVKATLIGDEEKTLAILNEMNEPVEDYEIIHETRELKACRMGVKMVTEGEADIPMKGLVQSAPYIMCIQNPMGGLMEEGNMLNEATAFYYPDQDRILFVGDCAVNIFPALGEKRKIINNIVKLAGYFGYEEVRVAAVSVIEKPDPTIPSSIEADELSKMEWPENMIVEGPFGLDNALDPEAARHKGIDSRVAGKADVLLMPDIHAGNIIHKSIRFFGHYEFASVLCGTKSPENLIDL